MHLLDVDETVAKCPLIHRDFKGFNVSTPSQSVMFNAPSRYIQPSTTTVVLGVTITVVFSLVLKSPRTVTLPSIRILSVTFSDDTVIVPLEQHVGTTVGTTVVAALVVAADVVVDITVVDTTVVLEAVVAISLHVCVHVLDGGSHSSPSGICTTRSPHDHSIGAVGGADMDVPLPICPYVLEPQHHTRYTGSLVLFASIHIW
jgi:hypothetical protein